MVSFALSVTIIKGYYPALVSAPILSKFVRANSIKMPPKYKLVLLIALVLVATSLAGRTKEPHNMVLHGFKLPTFYLIIDAHVAVTINTLY